MKRPSPEKPAAEPASKLVKPSLSKDAAVVNNRDYAARVEADIERLSIEPQVLFKKDDDGGKAEGNGDVPAARNSSKSNSSMSVEEQEGLQRELSLTPEEKSDDEEEDVEVNADGDIEPEFDEHKKRVRQINIESVNGNPGLAGFDFEQLEVKA